MHCRLCESLQRLHPGCRAAHGRGKVNVILHPNCWHGIFEQRFWGHDARLERVTRSNNLNKIILMHVVKDGVFNRDHLTATANLSINILIHLSIALAGGLFCEIWWISRRSYPCVCEFCAGGGLRFYLMKLPRSLGCDLQRGRIITYLRWMFKVSSPSTRSRNSNFRIHFQSSLSPTYWPRPCLCT